ncbi:hypothetical protein Tco_0120654 [Tanacetum coccineum]
MVIDKSWTSLGKHEKAFYTGLKKFVDDCKPLVDSAGNIRCPCKSCRLVLWVSIKHLSDHISKYGFDPSYKTWIHHGEPDLPPPPPVIDNTRQPQMSDMTASFIAGRLLIHGPKSPGKDIDVYLRPLIDDLKDLWAKPGVETIDVATGLKFNMRAMVIWTSMIFLIEYKSASQSLRVDDIVGKLRCKLNFLTKTGKKIPGWLGSSQWNPGVNERKRVISLWLAGPSQTPTLCLLLRSQRCEVCMCTDAMNVAILKSAAFVRPGPDEDNIYGERAGALYPPGKTGNLGVNKNPSFGLAVPTWNTTAGPQVYAGFQQAPAKDLQLAKKGCSQRKILGFIDRGRNFMTWRASVADMETSASREYPSLIHTFFLTHTVGGVFLNPEDKALYGTVIPPPSQSTHSVDIARLKKREKWLTKQVNKFMRLFMSDDKFSRMLNQLESQPEYGGGSGNGGCGDDEPGDDEDSGEDEEDEDDS